jgi:CBS domain-containing protein
MSVANTQPYRGSYLMPSFDHATVADAMHPGILGCEPDTSLSEVAQIMATHHVHCVAVIGISHEEPECGVWGVISDLDLVRAGIRNGVGTTARTLAEQPLVTVEPTVPVREASELMLAHQVTHLVVIQTGSGRPIGILSTADVAAVIAWGEA